MNDTAARETLLDIEDLKISFDTESGRVTAVDGVSLQIRQGETVGLVGESGCGKSVTSQSIMRLIPSPPGHIDGGRITLLGRDILEQSEREMEDIRGRDVSMIFQEPMTSLNPVFSCGDQLMEAALRHRCARRAEAKEQVVRMLQMVGIPLPERRFHEYPHQMSGGMRQRVMIAMALCCNPKLLIADEPTTALDVTIQAQILDLLNGLQKKIGMAILLITHDLGVIAETVERVLVMYAGKVVEEAEVIDLFKRPAHPYTSGLLASMPTLGRRQAELHVIPGNVPSLSEMPQGCRFHPRCAFARPVCRERMPELVPVSAGHRAACHRLGADWRE